MTIMLRLIAILSFGVLCAASAYAAEPARVVPQSRAEITLSYAPLAKRVTPAVVNIYTLHAVRDPVFAIPDDPLFRKFFEEMMPRGGARQRLENSLGSGVLVRADGLIVTSNHVIKGAEQIRVVLSDRREFDASVVSVDERSDLAVLRIDAKGDKLPYLELKDSDEVQTGDLVLAVGNPFGVGQTVTSGIVSAITRQSVGSGDLDYFIQTDAAINPGNSGGALVTMDGKLVGINVSIYSPTGVNLGIGFAVPSNMVRVVMDAVEQGKKSIVRPWIGIEGHEVTQDIAQSLGMSKPEGMLVSSVNKSSPAYKSGLRPGDVIVSLNGRDVEDLESFRYRIATLPIGAEAEFGVVRQGQRQAIKARLIAPPEDPPRDKTVISGPNPLAGATVMNLSPAVCEELGFREAERGVIVVQVEPGMPAQSVMIRPGDVVLGINGEKVGTVKDLKPLLASRRPRYWQLDILRKGTRVTIRVGG